MKMPNEHISANNIKPSLNSCLNVFRLSLDMFQKLAKNNLEKLLTPQSTMKSPLVL